MYNTSEDYLIELLMEENLVTESQVEDAKGQRKGTESLVETIVRTGQVKESEMAQCFAMKNGMEYLSLTNIPAPDKTVIDLIDLDVARRNSVVPIGAPSSVIPSARSNIIPLSKGSSSSGGFLHQILDLVGER